MIFSSLYFLFRFMPIVLVIYYILPFRLKNAWLLLTGLIFYAWGEPKYIVIMLASIFVDYVCGIVIESNRGRRGVMRTMLFVSIIFNLGMLAVFKYAGFFTQTVNSIFGANIPALGLALPLGISFYTFQTMSYTIDVYRGDVSAERNIVNFGAFVSLFPQLIAGPIVRYSEISRELKFRTASLSRIEDGVRAFIIGLGCKVLLANNIGQLWNSVEQNLSGASSPLAILGVIAYGFQIYFDFYGYSMMAIGLGRMFGFEFPQNFNYPYISRSVTEFGRRWHITLGSWFREYLYIPLGGNRKGEGRMYLNLFIVWFLTGLWHGAGFNFIIWGLYFGALICLEKAFLLPYLKRSRLFSRVYMIVLVLFGWAIFVSAEPGSLELLLSRVFSGGWSADVVYYLRNYGVVLLICGLCSTPLFKNIYQRREKKLKPFVTAGLLLVLILSVAYLVDATYNPFLYFRF